METSNHSAKGSVAKPVDALQPRTATASPGYGVTKRFRLLALLLAFSLALTVGLLFWSAQRQDEIAVAGSRNLASTALRALQSSMMQTLTDYTYWDLAYQNLAEDFNPDWFDDEIGYGPYMSGTFGITATFVIGPDNRVLRYMRVSQYGGEPGLQLPIERYVEAGIEVLINEARRAADSYGMFEASGGLVKMAGQTYIAAVQVIHPGSNDLIEKAAITPSNAYLMIFMRPLDEDPSCSTEA